MNLLKKRGFTLIEILVSIAILGIAATIVFAALGNTRPRSRDGQRFRNLQEIQKALEIYHSRSAVYPTSLAQLTTTNPVIMSVIPTDPLATQSYVYVTFGGGTRYHLGATMEQASTKGSNTAWRASGLPAPGDFEGRPAAGVGCVAAAAAPGTVGTAGVGDLCYDIIP